MSAGRRGGGVGVGGITREQKMLGAAAANVVFIISLFLDWFGASGGGLSIGFSGLDAVPSGWILLIIAALAAVVLAAEGFYLELPVRTSAAMGLYLSSIPFIVTLMFLLEGGPRKFGIWLAIISSAVAVVLAGLAWREEA